MELKNLGTSDLRISPLGIGTWAMGGDWQFGWGLQNDHDSVSAILRSVELGANWVDTAPVYGLGHSERIVGRALRELGHESPHVFTKCGMIWDDNGQITKCLTACSVRRECECSLQRLGVEAIDLLQIHWPTNNPEELASAWQEMTRLQDEGKVRYLGVCNMNPDQLSLIQSIRQPTAIQGEYSFLERAASISAIEFAKAQQVGFLAYSPLGSGLLAGTLHSGKFTRLSANDWRRKSSRFQGEQLAMKLRAANELAEATKGSNCSLVQSALAWVLANDGVTAAIVGLRTSSQATECLGSYENMKHLFTTDTRPNC